MRLLKIAGIVLLALIVLGLAGGGYLYWKSDRLLARTWVVPAVNITLPTDSAEIARGGHLAIAVAKCADCHGANFGGQVLIDGLPFARVVTSNLTPGRGGIAQRSDAELLRAIRHGVGADGRGLAVMPAEGYIHLTDADLGAIVAWLRTVAPVDSDLPPTVFGPIGRAILASGKLDSMFSVTFVDHSSVAPYAAPAGVTLEYGRYLAWIGGCHACHGQSLSGGRSLGEPNAPLSANITPGGLVDYTEQDFFRVLREGTNRGGRQLDDKHMPWRNASRMSDDEIRALWMYLQSVPAREFGAL